MTKLHLLRWALTFFCDPSHRMVMARQLHRLNRDCLQKLLLAFTFHLTFSFSATEYVAVMGNITHLLYRPLTTLSSRSVITIMETALGTPSPSCLCRSSPWNTMQAPSPIGWASWGLGAVGAIGHAVGVLMEQFWVLGIKPSICNCTSI